MTARTPAEIPTAKGSAPRPRRGIPRGSLADAEALAKGLWNAARLGEVPEQSLANELTVKASGSGWRTKMALLRVFHLMEDVQGGKIRLSQIGRKIVQAHDPITVEEGRREAVMKVKSYADVLESSNGTELPTDTALAGKLEHEYGISADESRKAAGNLKKSIALAGFVDDNGRVSLSSTEIEVAHETAVAEESEAVTEDDAVTIDYSAEDHFVAAQEEFDAPPKSDEIDVSGGSIRRVTDVTITATIDLSSFEPEDVIRILCALGVANE